MRTFATTLDSKRLQHAPLHARARPACSAAITCSATENQAMKPDRCQLLRAEQGDTLIEVIISAMLLALIVAGTLTGLNSTNHATAQQRARSQADAIAEQSEEQLRSQPINKLAELESHPETKTVKQGGTEYTVQSSATYINDTTATTSCTAGTAKAEYLQTATKVTWPSLGVGKPVVETSVISPPPGSSLIVQVSESGTPLQGAQVTATGPAPETTQRTLETSANGCAILAVSPGEYKINASKSGFITPNGYERTELDPGVTHSVYIVAETTARQGYYLARPGSLAVSFGGGGEGDTFVAFNTGMTNFKQFGAIGSYKTTVSSSTSLYPFPTKYTVYAGTCEADKPSTIKPENEAVVPSNGIGSTTLTLPQLKLLVYSGTSSTTPGTLVTGASSSVHDEGCNTTRYFNTVAGALPPTRAGLPYGNYKLCVTEKVGTPTPKQHRYEKEKIALTTAAGATETIYLGAAPEAIPTTC